MEKTGFIKSGYIVKKGTPSGADAKFNKMPPGYNISEQEVADIREMPMKEPTTTGYAE